MEVDDEDKRLLSSLGIASENPEDIERRVLSEVKRGADLASDSKEESNVDELAEEAGASSANRVKLYNQLRAVKVEIDAVASTLQTGSDNSETIEAGGDKDGESVADPVCRTANSSNLQHALAKDRLRSLEKAKAKLEREISEFGDCVTNDDILDEKKKGKLLQELVREKPVRKQKGKSVGESSRGSKRPFKTVSYKDDDDFDAALDAASAGFMETKRDELVRKGMLTPFYKLKGFERRIQQHASPNRQDEVKEDLDEDLAAESIGIAKAARAMKEFEQARPTIKLLEAEDLPRLDAPTIPFQRLKTPLKRPGSPSGKDKLKKKKAKHNRVRRPQPDKKWRKSDSKKNEVLDEQDGGTVEVSDASSQEEDSLNDGDDSSQSAMVLEGGLKIPGNIFSKLFDYQKVGVQWLWELHCQRCGGIIGDEMGLGKTIQVISFLAALHFSKMYKPSIVVCPVTLLRQWRREVSIWYPDFEVEILHDSASDLGKKNTAKFADSDSENESSLDSDTAKPSRVKAARKWDDMIDRVVKSDSGLLLTTYEQLRILGDRLLDIEWGYAVLDEGHRIRNPNAEVTLTCKALQTVHRIIMTGAPIQNKLAELWSLFDFVFPGKLGVLPVFEAEFAVPITVGGYANATPLQVSTAYRCAVVLRDLIMPYLLRRMKADVNAHLTKKTEHVLFCSLTVEQRSVYRAFLASSEVEQIFDGRKNSLYGIDIMRKICNHPDLLEREHAAQNPDYGNPERSGKMKVVCQVLKVWKEQGHRALLFAQTQQMLDIIENFLSSSGYTYRRMDGYTPVKQRMALIDEFNNSDEVFIFILTTKVGGLGTNLTGADRVIIYDPDWNPSTDMQARERAWRIGQTRDVTVYRLITRGTIEEKVYHRQIYKHFLTNKILKNPQQKRFFKARDMKDLFTLQEDQDSKLTETSNIFGQLAEDVNLGVGSVDQNKSGSASSAPSQIEMLAAGVTPGHDRITTNAKGKMKADEDDSNCTNGETDILKCLFHANGLHSAVNHDAIMNANDDEKVKMEQEASQIAQRAAQALRESRMLRSRESFAVPTWTGRAGEAGAPSSAHKRFGSTLNSRLVSSRSTEGSSSGSAVVGAGTYSGKALSSAELLAKIRGTQEKAMGDALGHDLDMASNSSRQERTLGNQVSKKPSGKSMIVQPEVLIRQLCSFIQQRGGYTDSASITQHFKDKIREEDARLFKNLLKEIATLEKNPNGTRWVLKPEYQ